MKKILIFVIGLICLCSCSKEPSIVEVENGTYSTVEALFNELAIDSFNGAGIDVNECRIDRYFIYEHPDDLTYKGTLKGTVKVNFLFVYDSVKVYKPVTVKFMDKKYERFSVHIGELK